MSDNRFSLDDILNEYPKKGEHNVSSNDSFDLDALLSKKETHNTVRVKEIKQEPAKKQAVSAIVSEVEDISEEDASTASKKWYPLKSDDNSVNIVIGKKEPKSEKFTTTMELDFEEKVGESNAFEAIESFKDDRRPIKAQKNEKRKQKKLKKQKQRKIEQSSVEEIPLEEEPVKSIENIEPPVQQQEKQQKPQKTTKKADHSERLSFEDKDIKPIHHTISGNTEIIDNLIRIKKERGSRTAFIPAIPRKSITDIDLKLDDKILPNTEQIILGENVTEIEKLKDLKERRKKKIRDFVLVGDEEEDAPDDLLDPNEPREISDFESFEDAPSILSDIMQLKGSLAVRLFILIISAIASIYIAVANDFNLPVIDILDRTSQPTTYLFINTILGLLSAFVSYTVISCGLTKLLSFHADCDSLSALAITSSILSSMICLASPYLVQSGKINIFIAVAITSLVFNTIGKLLIVSRTTRNFQYVAGDFERYAVFTINDEEKASQFTRGTLSDFPVLASMKKTEFITDFLKNSYSSDITDKFCKIAAPIIFGCALLMAFVSAFLQNNISTPDKIYIGIATFAGCIAICCCFAIMLVINLPMQKASKKYLEYSSAMLSYQSVEEFSDTNSVLIDVAQLFPQGMINLSAIKIFSDTRIDEAIVEAASLTNQAGSILKHMFYDIIAGKTEMLNPVESYIYEDSMGLCGWINNKRVLLGNRELMINHSIEGMPTKEREKEYTENGKVAVYLSISGELSAMFVIEIKASLEVQSWLKELERNEIYVMLRTVDSVISINKLAELFDISPDMLKLLPFRLHQNYEEETSYTPRQSASLACSGRFPSFASLIIGTKRIRKTANIGISIQAAAAILGGLIAIILTIMSAFDQLSASIVLAYNLAWTAVTLLLQGFRKA